MDCVKFKSLVWMFRRVYKKFRFSKKWEWLLSVYEVWDDVVYLILLIDDLLICGKNKRKIDEIKNKLSNKFAMKDLGEGKTYLGINIEYDHKKCEIKLDQNSYIESLAKRYNIENSKLYFTPME